MNKDEFEKMSVNAFENVKKARVELFVAAEKAIDLKMKLDAEEASEMAAGRFDGKNAETRKAQAREFFSEKYNELVSAESAERSARRRFDLASIDVDTVKTLLRIYELP